MNNTLGFEPDWASPPGATIGDLLEERRCSIRDFASQMQKSAQEITRLLNGIEQLTPDWAQRLAKTLGATPDFWLRREELYRVEFKRLCSMSDVESIVLWLDEVPFSDMVRFGWVEKAASKPESAMNSLAFFGVTSVGAWRQRYGNTLEAAAYRTSKNFKIMPGAVAAWLRQGEILAQEIDCGTWNPSEFRAMLPRIRKLSRQADPAIFIPQLTNLFAQCGVALVIAPLPDGCRASGATWFLNPSKARMLLSFRYLNDYEFWLTVFHEAGHLLLHAGDALFLEGIEASNPEAEEEANRFALTHLFTEAGILELKALPLNHFAIARFAKHAGLGIGVVVGQLQDMKLIPYRHFNYLKVHYSWGQ
jgi:HTH-type transcriptional regulator / antitoxin HigA